MNVRGWEVRKLEDLSAETYDSGMCALEPFWDPQTLSRLVKQTYGCSGSDRDTPKRRRVDGCSEHN